MINSKVDYETKKTQVSLLGTKDELTDELSCIIKAFAQNSKFDMFEITAIIFGSFAKAEKDEEFLKFLKIILSNMKDFERIVLGKEEE